MQAVVETQPHSTPPFSIDVEEHISKRLSDIADKEQIDLKLLTSELLRTFIILHRSETQRIIDKLKRNNHCPDR